MLCLTIQLRPQKALLFKQELKTIACPKIGCTPCEEPSHRVGCIAGGNLAVAGGDERKLTAWINRGPEAVMELAKKYLTGSDKQKFERVFK